MIFRRRKERQREINAANAAADRYLRQAEQQSAEAARIAGELRETRRRNHFGEAALASFQPRRRRGFS